MRISEIFSMGGCYGKGHWDDGYHHHYKGYGGYGRHYGGYYRSYYRRHYDNDGLLGIRIRL